jgi:hypothetical protein
MKIQGEAMVWIKNNGTTRGRKKTPLILKDFFLLKFGANEQSMAWGEKSHEDGLRRM